MAFALCSLIALNLEPTQPLRYVDLAMHLVQAYAGFAALVALWLARRRSLPGRLPLAVHAIDLLMFGLIILVTDGPSSPFGVALVFMLAVGAVRWQQRGAWWTAAAAIFLYGLVVVLSSTHLLEAGLEWNSALIRLVQLLVVAALLGYVSGYEQRLRQMRSALSEWPAPVELANPMPDLLAHAGSLLQAQRVLLVVEQEEEPFLELSCWCSETLERRRVHLHELPEAVEPELTGITFAVSPDRVGVRLLTAEGLSGRRPDPLPTVLRGQLGTGPVLAVPVSGQSVNGYLFLAELPTPTTDELAMAEVVAHQLALQLDQNTVFHQVHQRAMSQERLTLAHDLHDGVIQSLAAAALRLETVDRLMAQDPEAARRLIADVQDLLGAEQSELRRFLVSLQQPSSEPGPQFSERIDALVQRLGRHWHLDVRLDNRIVDLLLGDDRERHIHFILREALVNAARHGRADSASVTIEVNDAIEITVQDNGSGFEFDGTLSFEQLERSQRGPASLRRRVAALGGRMDISSSRAGARLTIRLPLA